MMNRVRDVVSIVFTGILAICALVVTGLAGITVYQRYWAAQPAATTIPAERTTSSIRLPELAAPFKQVNGTLELSIPDSIRGMPLVPEFATIVSLGGRAMLFLPVLMTERSLPVPLDVGLVDPLRIDSGNIFADCVTGRRSMWYMDEGTTMLYSVLLDPQFDTGRVGLGFVLVRRLDEDIYDVWGRDPHRNVLFAARGRLVKLDSGIGRGTLRPLEDQEVVRQQYRPLWEIDPLNLPLFSAG